MKSVRVVVFALVSAATLLLVGLPRTSPSVYTFHHEHVLGTSLELRIIAASSESANNAEARALAEIAREAKILSAYDQTSEFSRWVQTSNRPVFVSDELFDVLALFDSWRDRTGGAIDASAEVVTRVWKKAAAQLRVPSDAELASAVAAVHRVHWTLDPAARTATHITDAPLVLNSFTKGYIVDRAARAALTAAGVRAAVVNIGGDLVVRGEWIETVHVADPQSDADNSMPIANLAIRDAAVATSGNYRRGVQIGGRHYSHIVDPRTGRTADRILSATVVAPDPVDAGALATAFSVLTVEESVRLAESMPEVEFMLVTADGSRTRSAGWSALEQPRTRSPLAAGVATLHAAERGDWDQSAELTVTLELARSDWQSRRPYVAVWIEDGDRFPVRTLALWYESPRWLPDLRSWYRGDRLRALVDGSDIAGSISSATRPPGRYTLKWDGRDNDGKLVKAGQYTVCIEAAREHGTYQIIRKTMEFTGAPWQVPLPGNYEIAAASLDYRRIQPRQ